MKKILIISIGFSLGIVAVSGFLIYPLIKDIEENANQVFASRKELVSLEAQTRAFLPLKAEYEKFRPYFNKTELLFVDGSAPLGFIEFLEKIGRDSDISLEIRPASSLKKDVPWTSVDFHLTLLGPFPKCLQFVEKLENSPYLIEIQDLTARKLGQEELKKVKNVREDAVNVNLTLKAFVK